MKKFLVAILAILYISASTGATLHMHYCMGKLADWGLGHNDSKICSKCGMARSEKKDNGCCKDKHKFLKNNTDQKVTESACQLINLIAVSLPASFIEIPGNDFHSVIDENPNNHAPPRTCAVAVYIRNCVFLI
jgi:hypothetical protein